MFVFDRLTWRERFVIGSNRAVILPMHEPNIYLAYERFLESRFSLVPMRALDATDVCRVGIFPNSRIAAKNLPPSLIEWIVARCERAGFEPIVFALEGEAMAENLKAPVTRLPRNFAALSEAISSVRASICADSLPAHITCYQDRPVFVASPIANTYWLPYTAFHEQHWGIFEEREVMERSLDSFLCSLS